MISLSGCHLLTYLWQCSGARLHVLSNEDEASGVMIWDGETYRFGEVVLRPRIVIEEGGDPVLTEELHRKAHDPCFIARSVNFPVRHEPQVTVGATAS